MRPLAAAAVLCLAACSSEPETPTDPASPEPGQILAGVDLSRPVRLLGTEPFWGIDKFEQIDRWLATGGW